MKKFLLVCSFFLLQIVSCNFGIEAHPEATKLSIKNDSFVQLLNVRWNGTNFGNINSGEVSEKEISDGSGRIFFYISNGKEYRTQQLVIGEKYKHDKFSFINETPIVDNASNTILLGNALNAD